LGLVPHYLQAYIADVSKDKALGSNFGLFFGLAVGGGIALGVPLSAVVISAANDNPRVSFVVSGAICIVGGLGAWLCVPESLPPQRRRHMRLRDANPLGAFRMTWRNPYITGICLAYMCMSLARGGTQAIFVRLCCWQSVISWYAMPRDADRGRQSCVALVLAVSRWPRNVKFGGVPIPTRLPHTILHLCRSTT